MISRFEYLYTKSQIQKISNFLFKYELENGTYKEWDRFIHYNDQERAEMESEWDNYYKSCAESYWGKVFWGLYKFFRLNQLIKPEIQKALIGDTRIGFVKKPDSVDPTEIRSKMSSYFALKSKLEQLRKLQEEYAPVYDRAGAEGGDL